MNRKQKEQVVQELKESFLKSPASFVVGYKGLTVNQLQDLRNQLRAQGGRLKVTKARLMKIAVDDMQQSQVLIPHFKDQIGVVFAESEASAVAKVLLNFEKDNENLRIMVGQLDAELLNADAVKRIATLPSREVLLAQLCGVLKAPMSNFASMLNMHIVRLLVVLNKISETKQ